MSYTIIGQNNSVTTIDDGNGHTLHVPSRVALAIGTTFTIVEVNNNMATLEDSNGKIYRDIPCVVDLVGSGGGGGSSLPDQTGHSGEFLTTDGTDASWGVVDALPDQTGNAGKFLTTDGTDASWSDKPLVNNATGVGSIGIGDNVVATRGSSVVIGNAAQTGSAGSAKVAVGESARATGNGATAVGQGSISSGSESIAIGNGATASANGAVQIKYGTNSTADTFQVGSHQLMSADGTIPAARHASLPATDGTYVLKCVISGGVPTLSWVAE